MRALNRAISNTAIIVLLYLECTFAMSSELLLKSVEEGNLDQVSMQLNNAGVDINFDDPKKGTALHVAAKSGSVPMVALLLENDSDIFAQLGKGQKSPLHIAALEGHVDVVELLLNSGADINIKDKKGETPVYSAILKNKLDVVLYLVEAGADLGVISRFGDTPAYKSVSVGRPEATELLLKYDAPLSLEKVVEKKCSKCHGMDGRSGAPFSPNLAGMGEIYLVEQFKDYQTGARSHPKMNVKMINGISITLQKQLAAFYAAKPPVNLETDVKSSSRGKALYKSAEQTGISCVRCHSMDASAANAELPRLAGQNAEYLAIQMRAYRDDSRNNDRQGVMREATKHLSDSEILDLASYLQGL